MKDIILRHANRYPLMEPVDFVKLVYHSEFGGGHMIWDEKLATEKLEADLSAVTARAGENGLFEPVGCGMYRLNLYSGITELLRVETIARMFIHTGKIRRGSDERFREKLKLLVDCAERGEIFVAPEQMVAFLREYAINGYEPVHHSEVYRSAYHPCYRLVSGVYRQYFEVISAVEKLMKSRRGRVTVTIDGPAGAGKSTLAAVLKTLYPCNVFHMDDFRLPDGQESVLSGAAACADLDSARFIREVVRGLGASFPFCYHRFDAASNASHTVYVSPKRLNIIEGTYASYPKWAKSSQLRVFLNITPEKQRERLAGARISPAVFDAQTRYFREQQIREKSHIRLLTK